MDCDARLQIRRDGTILFSRVERPRSFFSRARGLIARPALQADQAWWFDHCNSIHMFGMTRSIDVVFVDCSGRIVKIKPHLPPFAFAFCGGASSVVEIAAGIAEHKGIAIGQHLELYS